jgi:hypothetical protein
MNPSYIGLNDLPSEILMIILKKLSNIEVLYSLIGVDKQLNKIAHESIFTNRLDLLSTVASHLI